MARAATATDHRLEVALREGYERLFDCTVNPADPTAALGQHAITPALLDDTQEGERPEVLQDEPQSTGQLPLVGVAYSLWEADGHGSAPSQFLGPTLPRKTAVGIPPTPPFYAVHAWIWRHNPDGIVADGNLNVPCPVCIVPDGPALQRRAWQAQVRAHRRHCQHVENRASEGFQRGERYAI